jgi:hypothetical protein
VTSGSATRRFIDELSAQAGSQSLAPDIPFPREYRPLYLARRRACAAGLYDSVGIATRADAGRQAAENYRCFWGAPCRHHHDR